ncbi:hypothetical protein GCM10023197_45130 [Gordonia humi]
MAEFYSLNLAQEVLKGMTQKATIGGTPTKAPIGYLNVRTADAGGREVRDIQIDPERADLIRFAFTAYATGDWSLSSLARELETRGLTTRPTPSRPAKPVTTTGLHKILTNPYFQGTVTFGGVTYDGTHEPLVDTETWLRVQTQLDAKNARGERAQKYDHYLKGSLHCSCEAKLMIERPRDNQGDRYEYFTCTGRRRKRNGCTRSAVLAPRIEQRIEATYGTNSITEQEAAAVRAVLNKVFDQLEASSDDERKLLETQRDKLDAERLKLVQAHYADAIPLDLLKSEQDRIRTGLDIINTRLDNLTDTYATAREGLDQITSILTDLDDLYSKCEPAERRLLNRALFDKIVIDEEENVTYKATEPVAGILSHATADRGLETNLPRHQTGQVSIFSTYVELRGLEPLTPTLPVWCATSCAIAPCSLVRTVRVAALSALIKLPYRRAGGQIGRWDGYATAEQVQDGDLRADGGLAITSSSQPVPSVIPSTRVPAERTVGVATLPSFELASCLLDWSAMLRASSTRAPSVMHFCASGVAPASAARVAISALDGSSPDFANSAE